MNINDCLPPCSTEAVPLSTVGAEDTHTVVKGLLPFTHYAVTVRAFNSVGKGPPSPPATGPTQQDGQY